MHKDNYFPKTGFVRLNQILAPNGPIPVSKSTWWAGCKDGRFPKPCKLGRGVTVWRAEEIRALFEVNEGEPLRASKLG
jgi:prophage regulatory protein